MKKRRFKKGRNYKKTIFFILSVFMTGFIWFQSMLSADASSAQSGFVTNIVNDILLTLNIKVNQDDLSFFIRKMAHFTEFFFLALFWNLYLLSHRLAIESYFHTITYSLSVALIDEWMQNSTPGRAMQTIDVVIDMAGVLFLVIVSLVIRAIYIKIVRKNHTKKAPLQDA